MPLLLALVAILVGIGAYLNWDLSRREARRRWQREMDRLVQAHREVADRVVDLFDAFARTREGTGRTAAAFAAAQRAYERVTAAFQPLDDEFQAIRAAFAQGNVGPLRERGQAVREGLAGLGPLLDELERQIQSVQALWDRAPAALAAARQQVAGVEAALAEATAALGFAPPVRGRVQSLAAFLSRAEAAAATNPVQAAQMAEDLLIRLPAVAEEVAAYRSAAAAVAQAEAELADLAARTVPPAAASQVAAALDQARSALTELRPHLAAGRLDHFQERLLACQEALRAARRALRAGSGQRQAPAG